LVCTLQKAAARSPKTCPHSTRHNTHYVFLPQGLRDLVGFFENSSWVIARPPPGAPKSKSRATWTSGAQAAARSNRSGAPQTAGERLGDFPELVEWHPEKQKPLETSRHGDLETSSSQWSLLSGAPKLPGAPYSRTNFDKGKRGRLEQVHRTPNCRGAVY